MVCTMHSTTDELCCAFAECVWDVRLTCTGATPGEPSATVSIDTPTYTYLFDGCCRGELDPLEARNHGFSTRTGCEAVCNEVDDCVAIEVNGCLAEPMSCGGPCWTFHAGATVNYETIVNGQCVTSGDQKCYERT